MDWLTVDGDRAENRHVPRVLHSKLPGTVAQL